jgi:general secretion pathway protein A
MIAEPLLQAAMRHWGATAVPFSDAAGQPCLTPAWQQVLPLLQQTAALRSLMLLSGESGVGKSTLASYWQQQLEPKLYLPLVITQSTLSGIGLLNVLLHKLGKLPKGRRSSNLQLLESAMQDLGRITPVVLLDDAQHYQPEALEEIRLLLGLNFTRPPLFGLILLGDAYLLASLRLRSQRAIYSRIAVYAQLSPLEPAQIPEFLRHGLKQVGIEQALFAAAAVDLLGQASEGLPRHLNLLARASWLEATARQAKQILPEHVQEALRLVPVARDKINAP